MGNTDSKMEQSALVADLQRQINETDRSVTGLAKSIDSMQALSKMLLFHLEKKSESSQDSHQDDENKSHNNTEADVAFQLLQLIEESVTDNKVIALQNINTLLSCLSNGLVNYGNMSSTEIHDEKELAVESYLARKIPLQETDTDTYYDNKIKSLNIEIEKLKTIVKCQQEQIGTLNEIQSGLFEEKDCLQRQVKQLEGNSTVVRMFSNENTNQNEGYNETEKYLSNQEDGFNELLKDFSENKSKEVVSIKRDLELEKKNHAEDVEKLEKEKKDLEDKYQSVLTKLEEKQSKRKDVSVSVQLFRPRGHIMVDNAFIQTLKSTADQNAMKLNLVRCANRDHIKLDDLVLILCECRTGEYLTNIFGDIKKKEIEMSSKVGVIIFHMKNERNIQIKSQSYFQRYFSHISCGSVFDIACDNYSKILSCDRNDETFNEIMKFISETGVRQSDSVMHR